MLTIVSQSHWSAFGFGRIFTLVSKGDVTRGLLRLEIVLPHFPSICRRGVSKNRCVRVFKVLLWNESKNQECQPFIFFLCRAENPISATNVKNGR